MAGKSVSPAMENNPPGCPVWLLPPHGSQPQTGMLRPSWHLQHSQDSALGSFCSHQNSVRGVDLSPQQSQCWLTSFVPLSISSSFAVTHPVSVRALAMIPACPSHPRDDVCKWSLSYVEQHISSPSAKSSSGQAEGRANHESGNQRGLSSTVFDAQPSLLQWWSTDAHSLLGEIIPWNAVSWQPGSHFKRRNIHIMKASIYD